MPEMTNTGKHHRDAVFIGSSDDFFVSDAAPRLDNAGCAGVGYDVDSVAEREERIGCDDRTA